MKYSIGYNLEQYIKGKMVALIRSPLRRTDQTFMEGVFEWRLKKSFRK